MRPVGFEIHWAELPLPQWIIDARQKATLLLLLSDFQPEFEQYGAAVHNVALDLRA